MKLETRRKPTGLEVTGIEVTMDSVIDNRVAAAIAEHDGPPVTYHATLADLILFADAAIDLGTLNALEHMPDERERVMKVVARMKEALERIANIDTAEIYKTSKAHELLRRAGV